MPTQIRIGVSVTKVVFKDPPPKWAACGAPDWADIARQVMARPGEWAYLGKYATGTISTLMGGENKAFTGEWEFTTRYTRGQSKRDLYARYLSPTKQVDYQALIRFRQPPKP